MFLYTKKTALFYLLAVFFISIDRFLKTFFHLVNNSVYTFNNLLSFNYAENKYISFSIPLPPDLIKYLTTLIVFFLILYFFKFIKEKKDIHSITLFFLILGASSNIYDRFQYGFVIDYINLKYFTIFNIADSMIFCSVLFFLLSQIKFSLKQK